MSDSGGSSSPWADPSTPTEPGAPYTGPPPTVPAPSAQGLSYGAYPYGPLPGYAAIPYGAVPSGPYGGWGPPPPGSWSPPGRPRTPGPVIAAAVVAMVQAALVLVAAIYVYFFATLAGLASNSTTGLDGTFFSREVATEGYRVALLQTLSSVLLVAGGVLALNRRSRRGWWTLLAALAVQLLLCGYWLLRLGGVLGDSFGSGGVVVSFVLVFAIGPIVALGLLLGGPARRWFGEDGATGSSAA